MKTTVFKPTLTNGLFHNYSFNNTILIAMQGGQLVAGYNKWRDEFHATSKGRKGIKIFAPAYKVKKEVPKQDKQGQPVKDKDGNTVTEQKGNQVPAFKIVSVFDVRAEPRANRCRRWAWRNWLATWNGIRIFSRRWNRLPPSRWPLRIFRAVPRSLSPDGKADRHSGGT